MTINNDQNTGISYFKLKTFPIVLALLLVGIHVYAQRKSTVNSNSIISFHNIHSPKANICFGLSATYSKLLDNYSENIMQTTEPSDKHFDQQLLKFNFFGQNVFFYKILSIAALFTSVILFVFMLVLLDKFRSRKKNFKILYNQKKEIERLNKKLRFSNETKTKLFSIVAHDANTSMLSVYELVDLVHPQNKDLSASEKSELYNLLQVITKENYQLFKNLIAWTRLQFEELEIKVETFNLKETINNVQAICSYKLKVKEIKLELVGESDILVKGDKTATELILLNLFSNALKYTERGGTVRLSLLKCKNHLSINVVDDGTGIPDNQIRILFDFQKSNISFGTENEKGVGLGLYISKELAERNGGRLEAETKNGIGSKFKFRIALA